MNIRVGNIIKACILNKQQKRLFINNVGDILTVYIIDGDEKEDLYAARLRGDMKRVIGSSRIAGVYEKGME